MENLRKELIDFHEWLQAHSEYGYFVSEFIIDEFLKSINSSPCERKADSNNEGKGEFCPTCGSHEKTWSVKNDCWYCKQCKHRWAK
jgi:hypothetical protein